MYLKRGPLRSQQAGFPIRSDSWNHQECAFVRSSYDCGGKRGPLGGSRQAVPELPTSQGFINSGTFLHNNFFSIEGEKEGENQNIEEDFPVPRASDTSPVVSHHYRPTNSVMVSP